MTKGGKYKNEGGKVPGPKEEKGAELNNEETNPHLELKETSHKLKEREKEISCIYALSDIINTPGLSLEEALNRILKLLPPAMQFPEETFARITIGDDVYQEDDVSPTEIVIRGSIKRRGEQSGNLEVYYRKRIPEMDDDPFLLEERNMIKTMSEIISRFIEQKETEDELIEQKNRLALFVDQQTEELSQGKGSKENNREDWQVIIDFLMKTDPTLLLRMTRKMLYHLARIQEIPIKTLMGDVYCLPANDQDSETWCGINMPNPRQDLEILENVQKGIFKIAEQSLDSKDISNLLTEWLKEEKARPLLLASQKRGIPLVEITDALNRFRDLSKDDIILSEDVDKSIRTNLIRRFMTERLEYINIAKDYINIGDFVELLRRAVGTAQGSGKMGGKSSGIFLAEKILSRESKTREDLADIGYARSWYLTSDTMWDLIHYNAMEEIAHIKYLEPSRIRQEQPFLEQIFKNSQFSAEIITGLKGILKEIGDKPLIVRSSSLMEDSFGAAFSGKYKSLFLANTGTEEERLTALMDAIAEVYASTFGPDPIEYRREREMLDLVEEMAILIQEVIGVKVGPYYLPLFAGVAFSNNEFRWSPRIRRDDGIVRMVMGLGTRAVDRIVDDYPVLVSPKRPEIRVNALVEETLQYSQRYIDVINLEKGTPETIPAREFLKEYGSEIYRLKDLVSIYEDGTLKTPASLILAPEESEMIPTFTGLFEKAKFLKQIRSILEVLEDKMQTPVDVEFASDGKKLFILQCRPQSMSRQLEKVSIPMNIPNSRKVFSADRFVTSGSLTNIRYIVYVDPEGYEKLGSREEMKSVASIVSKLNNLLPKRRFVLMGPGRWGSRGDIKLGVPVKYRDINNTCLLVEIAKKKGGYLPELSFGTHFFQDLVEADIQYLPLYPDDQNSIFNEYIFKNSPNHLKDHISGKDELEDVVKVIDIAEMSSGGTLSIAMDGENNTALGYIDPPDHWQWRMNRVQDIGMDIVPEKYGVLALYVIGSTRDATAGPNSDIDLLVHVDSTPEQIQDLMAFFKEWSKKLDQECFERTGNAIQDILDVHVITDEDILNRNSWAVHINSIDKPAKEIPLTKRKLT